MFLSSCKQVGAIIECFAYLKQFKTVYCDCWHHAVVSLAPLSYLDRELSTLSVQVLFVTHIEKPIPGKVLY